METADNASFIPSPVTLVSSLPFLALSLTVRRSGDVGLRPPLTPARNLSIVYC